VVSGSRRGSAGMPRRSPSGCRPLGSAQVMHQLVPQRSTHLRRRAHAVHPRGGAAGPETPAEELRQLHRPHPHHRAGTPRPAPGRLARSLGRTEIQPRLGRPVHPPDQPRAQQTIHRASPRRACRCPAAPTARRHHHRPAMGPRHRRRRQTRPDTDRRLTPTAQASRRAGGRGEPHAASRRDLAISPHILGSPARRQANPITRCRAPSP
jgi:hypothetical protein